MFANIITKELDNKTFMQCYKIFLNGHYTQFRQMYKDSLIKDSDDQ